MNYPPIKVYVNYRTPLIGLKTSGASSMRSTNFILSDPSSSLNLGHSGSSTAALELQHGSNLVADMSGSSRVTLSGQVQGSGRLSVHGAAKLSAIKCPIMQIVEAEVHGSGKAYVYGVEGVHARASGAGTIYYQGILLSQYRNGASSIMPYSIGRNREEF